MFKKFKEEAKNKIDHTFHKDKYKEMEEEQHEQQNIEAPPTREANTPAKKEGRLESFKHHLEEAGDYVASKASQAKSSVKKQLNKIDDSIKQTMIKQKAHLNEWIARKADEKAVKLLHSIEPKLTSAVEPSVPFDCLKGPANDAVLHIWKDLGDIIRFELKIKLDKPKMDIRKQQSKLWHRVSNWVVYSLYPADLTSRDHIRRFSFQVMKLAQLIPMYGIQAVVFLIIFLSIDKSEEYQLVNFIVEFKHLQFITLGLLSAIVGYMEYFIIDKGPGEFDYPYIMIGGYALQLLLLWIAFALLGRSKSKATFILDGMKVDNQNKGGSIRYFMIYEAIISVITLGLVALCYYMKVGKNQLGELLYFGQTVYGLLSFPFVIFIVQFFVRLITAATPTGYDQFGNCIPVMNMIVAKYKELPVLDRSDQIDIEEVMAQEDNEEEEAKEVKKA